jgi:hypothetical protein
MIRALTVSCTVLTIAPLAVCTANIAAAPPSSGQCSFVLAPLKVVQVSGVSMVAGMVQAGGCSTPIEPNLQVVCVSVEGDDSAGQCASAFAPDQPAVVYYPYRPGATYIATGKGCGQIFNPSSERCQDLGPARATM